MHQPTHAGGIVVRPTLTGPRFLVVRARAEAEEWVLPKGHLGTRGARRETPEEAARREVEEEAGVLAEVVAPAGELRYAKGEEEVVASFFLMRYEGDATPEEARSPRWLTLEAARKALTHEDARRLLDRALELLEASPDVEDRARGVDVMLKQLEFLNQRLKETSATANAFLAKFLFGGLIAVLALLNVDLVLLQEPFFASPSPSILIAVALLMLLSGIYFGIVTRHYGGFRRSHRKLKFKFELTLHSLLLRPGGLPEEYSRRLEDSVARPPGDSVDRYPDSGSRSEVLDYLLDHHRRRLADLGSWYGSAYFWLAMTLVSLTLVVRLLPLLFPEG